VSSIDDNFTVPLNGVDLPVLEKVVDFLKLYHADPMTKIEKVCLCVCVCVSVCVCV
jgi:hypothetical protein